MHCGGRALRTVSRVVSLRRDYRNGGPIMKKLRMLGIIGGAAILTAMPLSLQWSHKNVALSLDSAEAQIGPPPTATSVAGASRRVHRRAYRGAAYGTAYGHNPYTDCGYVPYGSAGPHLAATTPAPTLHLTASVPPHRTAITDRPSPRPPVRVSHAYAMCRAVFNPHFGVRSGLWCCLGNGERITYRIARASRPLAQKMLILLVSPVGIEPTTY